MGRIRSNSPAPVAVEKLAELETVSNTELADPRLAAQSGPQNTELFDPANLSSCYSQYKVIDIDFLFKDFIEQHQDTDSLIEIPNWFADGEESLCEFTSTKEFQSNSITADTDIEMSSICSHSTIESVEEPKPSSSRIVEVFKQVVSVLGSSKKKDTAEPRSAKTSGSDFTPVELTLPTCRKSSATMSDIVTGLIEGNLPSSVTSPEPFTPSDDPPRFGQTSNIVIYNENTSLGVKTGSSSKLDDPGEFEEMKSFSSLFSEERIGGNTLKPDWSFCSTSTSRSRPSPSRSILKSRVNEYADIEFERAHCCDEVGVEEFLAGLQVQELNSFRCQGAFTEMRRAQIFGYYNFDYDSKYGSAYNMCS